MKRNFSILLGFLFTLGVISPSITIAQQNRPTFTEKVVMFNDLTGDSLYVRTYSYDMSVRKSQSSAPLNGIRLLKNTNNCQECYYDAFLDVNQTQVLFLGTSNLVMSSDDNGNVSTQPLRIYVYSYNYTKNKIEQLLALNNTNVEEIRWHFIPQRNAFVYFDPTAKTLNEFNVINKESKMLLKEDKVAEVNKAIYYENGILTYYRYSKQKGFFRVQYDFLRKIKGERFICQFDNYNGVYPTMMGVRDDKILLRYDTDIEKKKCKIGIQTANRTNLNYDNVDYFTQDVPWVSDNEFVMKVNGSLVMFNSRFKIIQKTNQMYNLGHIYQTLSNGIVIQADDGFLLINKGLNDSKAIFGDERRQAKQIIMITEK